MILSSLLMYGVAAGALGDPLADSVVSAAPQTPPVVAAPADPEAFDLGEVVITGGPQRGAVVGDIKPELVLDARDIRAYGANNITDLLAALAPQTGSAQGRGGGRPVVLLNGRRISGFREIRSIPTEAIERVEILPEEVALSYGYRADQRVVNFVLRERFRALTTEAGVSAATAGDRTTSQIASNALRIRGDERWTLDVQYQHATPVYESDRDIVRGPSDTPYDRIGNIGGVPPGGEIDPALSILAGSMVTVAGVPVSATSGPSTLADFAATANRANTNDDRAFRTLLARSDSGSINGAVTRAFGNVMATVNATVEASDGRSYLGLPTATFALPASSPWSPFADDVRLYRYIDAVGAKARDTDSLSAHLGGSANGEAGDWRWTVTGNYDRARTDTVTQRGLDTSALQTRINAGDPGYNPFAPLALSDLVRLSDDRSRSMTRTFDGEVLFNGSLYDLPAGPLTTTFKAGYESVSLDSRSERSGITQTGEVSRQTGSLQTSLNFPITDRGNGVLAALGDLSANLNLQYEDLSDFGGLTTIGYGLTWSPVEPVRFIVSYTDEDGAPTVQQLNDPTIFTPGVATYDYATGQTVDVTRITGGNSGLTADNRRVFKLGVNWQPIDETDLRISADYVRSNTRDQVSDFPSLTPDIEAAFPDRFTRDLSGQLTSIDARAVNFARADRQEIRWGFNYSRPIRDTSPPPVITPELRARFEAERDRRIAAQTREEGRTPQAAPGDQPAPPAAGPGPDGGPPPGEAGPRGPGEGGRFGGPGGGGGGRGGFGGRGGPGAREGRLQLAVYHTWRFQDEILIRDGLPVLDLLDGAAVGSRGGQPRHEVDLQAGYSLSGLGARMNVNWKAATDVNGTLSSGDLHYSDQATVGLKFFADLSARPELIGRFFWLRGSRISLDIDNLFDSRLDVRDSSGETPVGYQPDYLDPTGRTIKLSFRKLLF
ncbi:MAG: TonB-dependent receptor plug domain-containing protein [Brevundimonas sp.]